MENTLGKRIQENRKRLGLTQEQLAEKLGVTGQAVSKWESDISCPDIASLAPLSDTFNISIDELMRGRQQETSCIQQAESIGKSVNDMMMRIIINVDDEDEGPVCVKVNIPVVVVKAMCGAGMGLPQMLAVNGAAADVDFSKVDFDSIIKLVEAGFCGELLNINVKSKNDEDVEIRIIVE